MAIDTKPPRDVRGVADSRPAKSSGPSRLSPTAVRSIQGPANKPIGATSPSLPSLRRQAVNKAWAQERQLVQTTGRGTRAWTPRQVQTLKDGGRVPGYQGHHIRSVNRHTPKWAGDSRNIQFVTRREHLRAHHGSFRIPTTGRMIDRPQKIRAASTNRLAARPLPR